MGDEKLLWRPQIGGYFESKRVFYYYSTTFSAVTCRLLYPKSVLASPLHCNAQLCSYFGWYCYPILTQGSGTKKHSYCDVCERTLGVRDCRCSSKKDVQSRFIGRETFYGLVKNYLRTHLCITLEHRSKNITLVYDFKCKTIKYFFEYWGLDLNNRGFSIITGLCTVFWGMYNLKKIGSIFLRSSGRRKIGIFLPGIGTWLVMESLCSSEEVGKFYKLCWTI